MQSIKNTISQLTDFELITKFQVNQDVKAYTELYNRYFPKVLVYCLKSLNNKLDAQDAAQDVFLKVFENLSKLKHPQLWVAWVFSITRNKVLNMQKRNACRRMNDKNDYFTIAENTTDLEAMKEKESKLTALPKLLETPDARILKMKYVDGRTIEQLSKDMHLKESAVKMRLLRARHHVVQMYEQRYHTSA